MTAASPAGQRFTPLDMLARLVAFDTVSHKSNLPLIDFVEDYLAGWGVTCHRFPNAAGDKAALFATLGPQDRGGVGQLLTDQGRHIGEGVGDELHVGLDRIGCCRQAHLG